MTFFTVSFISRQSPIASGIIRIEATDRNDAAKKLAAILPIKRIRDVFISSEQSYVW